MPSCLISHGPIKHVSTSYTLKKYFLPRCNPTSQHHQNDQETLIVSINNLSYLIKNGHKSSTIFDSLLTKGKMIETHHCLRKFISISSLISHSPSKYSCCKKSYKLLTFFYVFYSFIPNMI